MRGYPKHLNTHEDYEYVLAHFPRTEWEKDFQALLNTIYDWFFVDHLENEADGILDETHKIVSEPDMMTGASRFMQYEWKMNPDAKIFQVGYTEDEVREILE